MTAKGSKKVSSNTLGMRASRKSRRLRLECLFVLLLFVSLFFAGDHVIALNMPEWRGYLWYLFYFMVLFGFIQTILLPTILSARKDFYDMSKQKDSMSVGGGFRVSHARRMLQNVAANTGVNVDDVQYFFVDDPSPNAFFTGTIRKMIAVHRGAFECLTEGQLEAVLAHEIGHMVHRDIFWLLLMQSITQTFMTAGKWIAIGGTLLAGLRKGSTSSGLHGCALGLFMLVLSLPFFALGLIFAPLGSMAITRRRETLADMFATVHGYGSLLQEAFVILDQHQKKTKPASSAVAGLYISQPDGIKFGDRLQEIIGSHPLIVRRIRNIRDWLNPDEGSVPDAIEYPIKGFLCWVLMPAIFGVVLWFLGADSEILSLYGRTVIWLWVINALLSGIGGKSPAADTKFAWPVMAFAIVLMLLFWWIGFSAITHSELIGRLNPLVLSMQYCWIATGILFLIEAVRQRHGFLAFLMDATTYVALLYALVILWEIALSIGRLYF